MSNTLFALWLALSAGLLLLFFYAAVVHWRTRRIGDVDLGELIPSFLPVDGQVIQELAGPAEATDEEPGAETKFGKEELAEMERERAQLAVNCLRRMAHNAALLQRLGYSQLQSPNPLVCSLAQEMIDAGVNVRLYAFLGLAGLRLRRWFSPLPWLRGAWDVQGMFTTNIIPAYQALKEKTGNLTCLKFSGLHEELAASL
jgi:hypothetical protein